MSKIKLMAHLVAGYPTDEIALEVARSLIQGGADILEVQLPFSDPSADGIAIQTACTEVLSRDYKTLDGLNFIKKIHNEFPNITIYIMSYASLVYTPGVEHFCKLASESGVSGLIIPDLPFDNDEGLTKYCNQNNMENIPVAAPSMTDERLQKLINAKFKHIYVALRAGITGSKTTIDSSIIEFLKKINNGDSKIYGGFGISDGEQSELLSQYVDSVVAGSVFVNIISKNKNNVQNLVTEIKNKAKEISHS